VLQLGGLSVAFAFEIWRRGRGAMLGGLLSYNNYCVGWSSGLLRERLNDRACRYANLLGRDRLSATDLVPSTILASSHSGHD
jgi:hypothetical protein